MTRTKWVLTVATSALILGVAGFAAASARHDASVKNRIVVAADDDAAGDDSAAGDTDMQGDDDANSDGSAKMGAGEGTHEGDDQGSAPENDTDKIDQPARRNPTTGGAADEQSDDVMPPDEDEDSDQPE